MNIRIAALSDLDQIDGIYNQAVDSRCATGDTQYLSSEERLKWFNEHVSDKYPVLVAESDDKVNGWISLSPYRKGRKGLRFTAEVSYYIHNDYQRMGVGSALIDEILRIAGRLNYKTVIAIVIHINSGSIKLLEKFRFKLWGLLPDVVEIDSEIYSHKYYGLKLN